MALFNFISQPKPDIEGIRARLMEMLGPQMLTQQQAGPLLPGQERQDITAAQQGTGVFQPKIAELLSGLIASPETRGVGSNLLQGALGQKFGLGKQEGPSDLLKKITELVALRQSNPEIAALYEQVLLKPSVQINQGGKILGENAGKWINPTTGAKGRANMTVDEAVNQGLEPHTTDELKNMQAGQAAAPLVSSLAEIAFGKQGEKSLFPPATASVIDRIKSGIGAQGATLTDSDQRLVIYDRTKSAFVSQLARLAGQVGTLTDRDVDTVKGLLPTPGFTPEPIAKAQFKQIAKFLESKGVPRGSLVSFGLPKWAFEDSSPALPPGFVED